MCVYYKMSKYPEAFKLNCVGQLDCNNNYSVCGKKPIILENNEVKDDTTTTHCLPYEIPKRVIQNNDVDFDIKNTANWSNTRGYGNIVVATNDTCNNVHGRIHPWNRIYPLGKPYSGPADIKNAWNVNKVKLNRK